MIANRSRNSMKPIMIVAIVAALMVGGLMVVRQRLVRGTGESRFQSAGDPESGAVEPGRGDVVSGLNQWVHHKIPRVRKRLKRKISRLKQSLVGD